MKFRLINAKFYKRPYIDAEGKKSKGTFDNCL